MTPFEVLYGQKPPLHLPYIPHSSMVNQVDRSLQARETTIRLLKHHLLLAQSRMKAQADKHRTLRSFNVGDMVFVKLQLYRQISLKNHSYHKLSPRYFGPFRILKRVGTVAYQLDLPPQAKIHHTFHVSQLKSQIGTAPVTPNLPISLSPHGYIVLEPEGSLDKRVLTKSNRQVTQLLVKWFNCPTEDRTWVDLHILQQQFPTFVLEAKGS